MPHNILRSLYNAFINRFWDNAPNLRAPTPSPPIGRSFEEWEQLLRSITKNPNKTLSLIPTGGTISPRSCLGDQEHSSEDEIQGMMAKLELLRDAQQAGQIVAQRERVVWGWELYEIHELMNVVSTAGPDEETLKTLKAAHEATAKRRKRRREEEELEERPRKRIRYM